MLFVILGAAAGFVAARTLLRREVPERLPGPLRDSAERARSVLLQGQSRVREAIDAGHEESARKQRELTTEYLRQARRQ